MDSMSLVELKQLAKTRRIKMYYTKKRHELIRLLSMPDLPDSFKIEKLTIVQLRQQAKEKGMRGFWGLSRDQLVNLLYPNGELRENVHEENENGNDAEKCENPQP
jgi:exonuclease V gamma subunit